MSQCTAKSSRTGQRCRKAAIRGGTVCLTHGGSAPQVREAARRRLQEALLTMVDPALLVIHRALTKGKQDELPTAIEAQVANKAIERAGRVLGVESEQQGVNVAVQQNTMLWREFHDRYEMEKAAQYSIEVVKGG